MDLIEIKLISKALRYFDVEKVVNIMNQLDWKWANEEVTKDMFIENAIQFMHEAFQGMLKSDEDWYTVSCGGIEVIAKKVDGDYIIELKFILESAEIYYEVD